MMMQCNTKKNLDSFTGPGKGSKQLIVAGFTLIEILIVIAIIFILAKIANIAYESYFRRARNSTAMVDVRALEVAIFAHRSETGFFPDDLSDIPGQKIDPWGRPYYYMNIANDPHWHGKCRRDRKLNPLNTDFDLYSMGEDGKTKLSLTPKDSHDDIVRASNGRFVGLGADY
jgi:general secretion pathway protein G